MSGVAAHRAGAPSPLIFHLSAALAAYGQALLAAPRAGDARFPWREELRERAHALEGGVDQVAVAAEIASRLRTTLDGLERWQSHPYRRALADPPEIWRAGATRLLDYGASGGAPRAGVPVVLVVPSLINRAYILDLIPERSFLRWLAGQGLRPVLLDWGRPGRAEQNFGLDDYGRARLAPALERLCAETGGPVSVLGYCMGGTLAAGLAARCPDRVARLATIGAPWDFSTETGVPGLIRAALRQAGPERVAAGLRDCAQAFGYVPVVVFDMMFALVNPMQAALKFQKFAKLRSDGLAARLFVALEDWLTDGVPMAGPAAEDLLVRWQLGNAPGRGGWRFLGGPVDLGAITVPTLTVVGRRDTISPPEVSRALAGGITGAQSLSPALGHVGMVVGSGARSAVWRPLADFLARAA